MRTTVGLSFAALALVSAPASASPSAADFTGSWFTTYGRLDLEQTKDEVTGSYGDGGKNRMSGRVKGRTLSAEYDEGGIAGEATFDLSDAGNSFRGRFKIPSKGREGEWNGVRQDAKGEEGPPANFKGTWLAARGLFEMKQSGTKVEGRYPAYGPVDVKGDVKGRRLTFRWKGAFAGSGWLEMAKGQKGFVGAVSVDGQWGYGLLVGRPAPEFVHRPKPKPGAVVTGATSNMLGYHLRVPEGWAAGKPAPAIVLLHGSNMTARAYVDTFAAAWPDLAKRFVLVGIDGETFVDSSPPDAPQFNYTYVNFVGKSTYKGFPGTDRESPALVSDAVAELAKDLSFSKVLVGGHSQGGFLTYSLAMNYPDLFAGAFPVSAGLIFQAEPSAYADEAVRAAQRRVAWAIVHGENDGVVDFAAGKYAFDEFSDASFPALRFVTHKTAAHMFAVLPVDDAIRWLDEITSSDPEALAASATAWAAAGNWRDAAAAVKRGRDLSKGKPSPRLDAVEARVAEAAREKAKSLAAAIAKNADASWVDGFLAFRRDFEFAEAAKPAMDAYAALRAEHEPKAKAKVDEGREARQRGEEDTGWAAYREVLDRWYASSWYPKVKRWFADRK